MIPQAIIGRQGFAAPPASQPVFSSIVGLMGSAFGPNSKLFSVPLDKTEHQIYSMFQKYECRGTAQVPYIDLMDGWLVLKRGDSVVGRLPVACESDFTPGFNSELLFKTSVCINQNGKRQDFIDLNYPSGTASQVIQYPVAPQALGAISIPYVSIATDQVDGSIPGLPQIDGVTITVLPFTIRGQFDSIWFEMRTPAFMFATTSTNRGGLWAFVGCLSR